MQRHFKVRAKNDFTFHLMDYKRDIKKGEVFDAQDIVVTVNKTEKRHLGVKVSDVLFYDFENHKSNFEEIAD